MFKSNNKNITVTSMTSSVSIADFEVVIFWVIILHNPAKEGLSKSLYQFSLHINSITGVPIDWFL